MVSSCSSACFKKHFELLHVPAPTSEPTTTSSEQQTAPTQIEPAQTAPTEPLDRSRLTQTELDRLAQSDRVKYALSFSDISTFVRRIDSSHQRELELQDHLLKHPDFAKFCLGVLNVLDERPFEDGFEAAQAAFQ